MIRMLALSSLLLAGMGVAVPDASACHRSRATVCYTPCYWEPCWPCPPCHYCYCLAYRDPYLMRGSMWVRCDCCPHYLPGWHWCYVYLTGQYEWVKVYRCYPYGSTYDKDAEAAEGFKKAAADMPGKATIAVNLPAGARLTIDGAPAAASTDTTRWFETSTLEAGQSASFVFAAESTSGDGRVVKRVVTVRPYETTTIDLGKEYDSAISAK